MQMKSQMKRYAGLRQSGKGQSFHITMFINPEALKPCTFGICGFLWRLHQMVWSIFILLALTPYQDSGGRAENPSFQPQFVLSITSPHPEAHPHRTKDTPITQENTRVPGALGQEWRRDGHTYFLLSYNCSFTSEIINHMLPVSVSGSASQKNW